MVVVHVDQDAQTCHGVLSAKIFLIKALTSLRDVENNRVLDLTKFSYPGNELEEKWNTQSKRNLQTPGIICHGRARTISLTTRSSSSCWVGILRRFSMHASSKPACFDRALKTGEFVIIGNRIPNAAVEIGVPS